MKLTHTVFVLFVIALLAACTPAEPQETLLPPAEETAPTGGDAVQQPTITPPAPTETAVQADITEEQILIAAPGTNSLVTSPFVVEGLAVAPFGSVLGVRLTNANGVILAEEYPQVNAQMGQTGPFRQELAFSGIEEETVGRLTVFSTSPIDGGLVHASSVVIRLLPGGEEEITLPDDAQENIKISDPVVGDVVRGGLLTVSGVSDYYFEANLSLALCGGGGGGGPHLICGDASSVLAEGYAMIDSPDVGIGGEFSGELQYTVDAEINARIVVYALSPMDGAIEHLSSVDVTLAP